ncbi:MAG TPA: aryl-sulfate sulfotransferase [Chitinophagales bacterium]|nr:aryl-sulfate sulfotransferase [Chitinophagales bacterium]
MPDRLPLVFGLAILALVQTSYAQFTYISPMPESKLHKKETGIILRTGETVNAASLRPDLFLITGSVSGAHILKVKLAADNKSILIRPLVIFSAGETVTVTVNDGIRNFDGRIVHGITFWFQVSQDINVEEQVTIDDEDDGGLRLLCDGLPPYVITSTPGAYYDEPIFYRNWVAPPAVSSCWTVTIISSEGDSIYSLYDKDLGYDFKINDNGYLTYFDRGDSSYDMLDSSYNLVKKMFMGNGYKADRHEFRIYPDGYHFMQCFDGQVVDMTQYGGQANAEVIGLVIQQIDSNDDVIFEWRSWDHFLLTDAVNDILLTSSTVDYVHGNTIELDFDGNLLISSRHLDEITKIDLSTGDIIWRMGGENNEFTFIDNPDTLKPFSHQHHFRRLPNGHYSLFDNGNYQYPERSKAKEFVLDQVNKTATLVWSYIHPPVNGFDVYGSSLGSVEVLPNGNRFIDWGQISPNSASADIPNFTEVDSNGTIVWEFSFVDSSYVSYRAYKFPWDRCNLITEASLIAENITTTSVDLHWSNHTKFSGFSLEYNECDSSSWINVPLDTNFYHLDGLQPNTCYNWRVESICVMYGDSFYTPPHQFTTLNPVSAFEPVIAQPLFTLYPNPATGETQLNFFCRQNCQAEVTIYNLPGAVAIHRISSALKGINKSKINLEFLRPGLYIVELKLCTGVQYRRLVKQ